MEIGDFRTEIEDFRMEIGEREEATAPDVSCPSEPHTVTVVF